jgi:hypothetical protein
MILIKDEKFKNKLESLVPYGPYDESEFYFKKYYNSTSGNIYYPFFLRYPIVDRPFLKAVEEKYIEQLKSKKIKPLIIMINESWNLFEFYNRYRSRKNKNLYHNTPYFKFINFFKELEIQEKDITWIVNNPDIKKQIEILKEYNISIKSNFFHFNFFLQQQSHLTEGINFNQPKRFDYHYINMAAGEPRHHRYGMVYKLKELNLLKYGKVSCSKFKNFKYNYSKCFHSDDNINTEDYLKKFNLDHSKIKSFIDYLPIKIDGIFDPNNNLKEEHKLYENVFIDLVNETHQPDNQIFVTEKTFRPIAHLRPFIINGDRWTLKYLKDLGFKTFDKWWDESYDNKENDWERIKALTEIIKKLCVMSTEKLLVLYEEMLPILEHNKQILKEANEYKNLESII